MEDSVSFSIKELFVEIRDDLRSLNSRLEDKADVVDLDKLGVRLADVEKRLNDNDTRWASLRGYLLGAAIGSGLLSGGVVAGIAQVVT